MFWCVNLDIQWGIRWKQRVVWIRYPKHVWFSSRFSLGIKTHARVEFSHFFIGYQTYELLMSFRTVYEILWTVCRNVWTVFEISNRNYFSRELSAVHGYLCLEYLQYSPKIMHKQELLFASTIRSLLAADCESFELESWKPQELLCRCMMLNVMLINVSYPILSFFDHFTNSPTNYRFFDTCLVVSYQ